MLQRKCACGQHTHGGGECEQCRKKHLKTSNQTDVSDIVNVNFVGIFTDSSFGKEFSRVPTKNTLPPIVQPKLKINQPGDKYEQEANRITEQVMQMPDSEINNIFHNKEGVQGKCSSESSGKPCPKCAEEKEEKIQLKLPASQITPLLQRSENNTSVPEATLQFFEPRFGRDFSDVRVHSDVVAGKMASLINATAFTLGRHVFFAQGQYNAGSVLGRRLLAHELTHTIQQQDHNSFLMRQSGPGGAHELR